LKIDPATGTSTTIYTLDTTEGGNAITSDDTYLWVSVVISAGTCGNEILRIPIAGGQVYRFTVAGDNSGTNICGEVMGTSELVSAGSYLYASTPYPQTGPSPVPRDFAIERITKPNTTCSGPSGCPMAIGTIAGSAPGYANGEWSSAQFDTVRRLASSGSGANPSLSV